VCGWDCTNAKVPSAAVVPCATIVNPVESASRHRSSTVRPLSQLGSPVTAPDNVTSLPKVTVFADADSPTLAEPAIADGTRATGASVTTRTTNTRSERRMFMRAFRSVRRSAYPPLLELCSQAHQVERA
jgi:hypothetical protein